MAPSRKILSPLCVGKVSPPQANFFLEVDGWQNGDMLSQMHLSLSAQSVLSAAVVAPTINHTTHGWYCTPLLSHTQYSLRIGLKLICMFFSNIHYLLTIRRYMYLKIPETVHPNGPNTTHSATHCIDVSDPADFIHLSDKFRKNCKC